jgi:hypothetical protein
MASRSIRRGIVLAWVLATAVLPALGCRGALMTALFLFKGTDVDPDFAGLKDKKVAVVCRPLVSLQYRNASAARDLAHEVSSLLEKNVPKIQIIDQRKVDKWTDENNWEEYTQVGKAVKADMVVGVDLEDFSIFQGQTIYQGKANVSIHVYDCGNHGKQVFEKSLPQSVYPPNCGVPTSDKLEAQFRREFVAVLAGQIARYFYSHDPYADMAQDAAAFK